jgi:methylmalonyl-CoA mutase
MNIAEKGFAGFAPITREQWKAKAVEDLKGADYDKKLVWKTDDGFSIQPFYTPEDLSENKVLKAQDLSLSEDTRQWVNYTQIPVADAAEANQMATEMVSFGATGILFQVDAPEALDFAALLQQLDPQTTQLSFATAQPSPALVQGYFAYLAQQKIELSQIRGFYSADVLETWITTGAEPGFDTLAAVVLASESAPNFKTLVVQSHAFLNAGASTTQELAFTLNKLTDLIDRLTAKGLTVQQLANNLLLHLGIGGDYFFEIAKLRAARILLRDILRLYGVTAPVAILSSNSIWSKSFYDANVNMLRNTTEAMSALLGGCDALLTYPHDYSYGQPSSFSRRIALNISNLLKEESYFDKVVDPAGGSYYLETLTGQIAEQTLNLFKEVEAAGGFIQAFSNGSIQQKIEAVKQKKEKEIALRRRVYVGTNKYPNLDEKAVAPAGKNESKGNVPLLVPQRATQLFEELRSRTLSQYEQTGVLPKVYLACFGNLASRKARAGFASEFFGTAGFNILGEFFFPDVQTGATESANSDADIVVMCSSDADYETSAVSFIETFKSINKDKLLVLAGYPEALVADLQNAGVDSFIHIKSNAVEMLTDFQNRLFSKGQHTPANQS